MINIHITSAPAFLVAVTAEGFRYADMNEACIVTSGYAFRDFRDKTPRDLFTNAIAEALEGHYAHCVASREATIYQTETADPAGFVVWTTTLVPLIGRSGAVEMLVGYCADRTSEHLVERAASAFREKLSLALGTIKGGYWAYDVATEDFEISRSLVALIAGPARETMTIAEYRSHIFAEDLAAGAFEADGTTATLVDFRARTSDGRTLWLQSKRQLVRDEGGRVVRTVALVSDITAEKSAQLALEDEANRDDLTRLRNRRAFERLAASRFDRAGEGASHVAIVIVDLDAFKPINDLHGHRMGDDVLRLVAERIARLVRPQDMVARIGGDEFAVLVADPDAASQVRDRIMAAFEEPLRIGTHRFHLGASCGLAMQNANDECFGDVIERADRALYEVKRLRKLERDVPPNATTVATMCSGGSASTRTASRFL